MITNTKIRKVNLREAEILLAIAKETFIEAFAAFNTKEDMQSYVKENFTLQRVKKELNNKNSLFYFADYRGQVVGYLKVNLSGAQTEVLDFPSLEIERIYVSKECYGKGVANLLFDQAVSVAKENKLPTIWLGVWDQNPRAIKFYEKQGFEVFGTHDFKLGSAEQTDLMMKLDLTVEK